jgi:hypothetical protein
LLSDDLPYIISIVRKQTAAGAHQELYFGGTAGTSAELGAFVKSESTRWSDVMERYNIKAE